MTTALQQAAPPLTYEPIQPLRSLIDSSYGQSAIAMGNKVYQAGSASPSLVAAVQSVIAAGLMAKAHLPPAIDEKLNSAIAQLENVTVDEAISQIDHTLDEQYDGAKTKLTNVAETAKATIDTQLNQAKQSVETVKGKFEQSVETAKEQVSNKMTESLTAIDRNQQVNQVVTLLEPAVLSVVDYVLPEDEADTEDNSKDEDTKILDLQPEQALKTTLRLGKNVSKRLQKRWVAAALQISSLSSRVEGMKHIDLIAYSNAIPSRVAGVYDQWPVLQQGMKQFQESAKPYQGLALQQLDNVRQFGSLQLVKLNLQVKPVMLAGMQMSTKTANFFGIVIEKEDMLKLLKDYPQLHGYFVELFEDRTSPPPPQRATESIENAKVESAKEMGILQR